MTAHVIAWLEFFVAVAFIVAMFTALVLDAACWIAGGEEDELHGLVSAEDEDLAVSA